MKTLLFTLAYFFLLAFVLWLFRYIGRYNAMRSRNKLKYVIMYLNIKTILDSWQVNEASYYDIWRFLCDLEKLPHKNREKTEVLKNEFYVKYSGIKREILSQDEFSPEEVFMNNDLII